MGKVYTVANRKGGCSKTTTVGATASCLTKMGYKVLVVDMDPQCNLSNWSNLNGEDDGVNTTYEVMKRECEPNDAIFPIPGRYDLMPASDNLSLLEAELSQSADAYFRMKDPIEEIQDDYDVIFLDTPPNLGMLTLNAFVAAEDGVILTSDTSAFAAKGAVDLAESLKSVLRLNPNARIIGILLTKYNPRYNQHKILKDSSERFGKIFDAPVYKTFIRQSVTVIEAESDGEDLMNMGKKSSASEDYMAFAMEFVEQQGLPLQKREDGD